MLFRSVARDLKYDSHEIDLKKLADELHGEMDNSNNGDDDDPFAEGNYIRRA